MRDDGVFLLTTQILAKHGRVRKDGGIQQDGAGFFKERRENEKRGDSFSPHGRRFRQNAGTPAVSIMDGSFRTCDGLPDLGKRHPHRDRRILRKDSVSVPARIPPSDSIPDSTTYPSHLEDSGMR